MTYLDGLRSILNELTVGGEAPPADDTAGDDTEGDQDFMSDDGGGDDSAPAEDMGGDDTEGDQDFMSDDAGDTGDAGEAPPTDDVGDDTEGDQDFMSDDGGGDDSAPADDMGGDDTEGDQDFMSDDGGGDDTGDSGEESEDTGEETTDDSSDEEGENGEGEQDYDINKIEDELFSNLTPEQIAIKNHELKDQFIELYSIIGSTLVRINDIPKTNENVNILKFVTEKLLELREMVDFNVTTAYNTRTYIENNIIYQQCIATLNSISDILDNIPKLNNPDENTEEDSEEEKGEPVEQDDESSEQLNISDSSMSDYQEESTDYNSLL